jgi:hypothetical protein
MRVHRDLTKKQIEDFDRGIDCEKIDDIVSVLDGGGLGLLKRRVIDRFATEITKADNSPEYELEINNTMTGSGWKSKIDYARAVAVNSGLHTLSSTFGFKRICYSRATLFDYGAEYIWTPDGEWTGHLEDDRTAAFHDRRMARLDLLACGIGSAVCMPSASIRGLKYEPFDPGKIWVVYADEIYLDGEPATADRNDIDDASLVVLQLSDVSDDNKRKYVAMFGRSVEYPVGRMVQYYAESWHEIPDVGEAAAVEYVMSGGFQNGAYIDEVANPLTMYQDESRNYDSPEYPIINWQMDQTADGTGLFPMAGTMLFDVMFDLDVEYSRDIESAGRSARGAWLGKDPKSLGFDRSISEGESVGKRDQEVQLLSHSADNALKAAEVLRGALEQIGGAYNVPSHKITTKDSMQVASGFALQIMDSPLTNDRVMRAMINRSSMRRKFFIECAFANFVSGKTVVPLDADEMWTPKTPESAESPEERRAEIDWQLEKGFKSIADLAMDINNLETREAALEMIERNKAENSKGTKTAPAPGGILGRKAAV